MLNYANKTCSGEEVMLSKIAQAELYWSLIRTQNSIDFRGL